jgi:uncharacterized membrane protein YqiK
MTESGLGIGNLLSALVTGGLVTFILVLAVIGGIVAIFFGVAYLIKNSIQRSAVHHR